jgi:hypothetical protein
MTVSGTIPTRRRPSGAPAGDDGPGDERTRGERTMLFDPTQVGLAWALAMGPLRLPA